MHNIAITGASGFVGKHLVAHLGKYGYAVSAINLRKGIADMPRQYDAMIHLAGKAHDHKGTAGPEEYFDVNTGLTKAVFGEFLKSEAAVFIHFSTVAAVTDEHIDGVLTEDAVPHPASPYGQSKLQAEQYLLQQQLPAGKKLFIIRPAMIHGPGDKGNLTLLYSIVTKGIPYPLAAYHNKRSFLSIDNLNLAIELLLKKAAGIPSGIYNLVDDQSVATNDVVRLIAEVTGKKVKLMALPKLLAKGIARIGDVLPLPINSKRLAKLTGNYVVDNSRLKAALGLEAFPVTAMEGLRKTIKSFASN